MAQNATMAVEGAVARRVRGAEDADNRLAQSTSEMQRAGVSGDGECGAARYGDEANHIEGQDVGGSVAGGYDFAGKMLFGGAAVDQDGVTGDGEVARDGAVAIGRPALGAPAGSGAQENEGLRQLRGPGVSVRFTRQQRQGHGEIFFRDGAGDLKGLFDDVNAVGGDALVKEPFGGHFARDGFARDATRAAPGA